MAQKSALLRVVTGRGIIPRPNWLERILTAFDTHQTTLRLDSISDAQLRDMGLTRDEVRSEICRPVWDAPLHWHRA
ncbi:DUF1127 domain-containing protein [Paracoccus salsus]|uniref:DUF1127 domain-containing protein n=1 Tax=Paracoccus salsus TaxID=2911061 RepID=UPI001F33E8CA|nr:hypothetical protein [Paracoccus salsus]MCF3972092.1 hypothetical protein [Paracoccus salsus]